MDTPQYEQLQLFYTPEEVDAKVSEAKSQATLDTLRELAHQNIRTSTAIFEVMKEEADNTMTKADAQELYDKFVERAGLVAKQFTSKFTVSVSFEGAEIAQFEGIEAEDEDDAIAEVSDNIEIEAFTRVQVTYDGTTDRVTVPLEQYEVDLQYNADEED